VSLILECEIGGIDLVFVLDSSFSILQSGLFPRLVEFTVQISSVLDIGLDRSLVGVIIYSSRSNLIFNLLEHNSSATLLPALRNLTQIRGRTNTHRALRHLRTSADGEMGLREGRPHIAIVFTDGISQDRNATIREANRLHQETDYQVYAAGIGDANKEELTAIATSPSFVFFAQNLSATAIQQVEQNVSQQLCERRCKFHILYSKTFTPHMCIITSYIINLTVVLEMLGIM